MRSRNPCVKSLVFCAMQNPPHQWGIREQAYAWLCRTDEQMVVKMAANQMELVHLYILEQMRMIVKKPSNARHSGRPTRLSLAVAGVIGVAGRRTLADLLARAERHAALVGRP